MRTCRVCEEDKPLDQFPPAGSGKYKGKYRRRICNKCYYRVNTRPNQKRIRRWLVDLKKTLACTKCGIDDYRVLEFHHRPGTEKLFNIGDKGNQGWGKDTILKEIEKCDVLCANCHRIESYKNYDNGE